MPKRKHEDTLESSNNLDFLKGPMKNSLDSDEEDDDEEEDTKYQLKDDDIEGQEEGVVGLEEGVTITPFNMQEELEEGHFDKDGMYHWKKEKLARDNWLENIDWVKVKETEKPLPNAGDDVDMPEVFDVNGMYKQILNYLQPRESIAKALKRLGGNRSLSASERLKLKKAGKLPPDTKGSSEEVMKLTELANRILTQNGNMDVYQETYEQIKDKVDASSSKAKVEVLDMYADDFDEKEKERLADVPKENSSNGSSAPSSNDILWEYKETESSSEIKGPYSTMKMNEWSRSGHFKTGVLVRKCGSDQFYTSNRIDFGLYM